MVKQKWSRRLPHSYLRNRSGGLRRWKTTRNLNSFRRPQNTGLKKKFDKACKFKCIQSSSSRAISTDSLFKLNGVDESEKDIRLLGEVRFQRHLEDTEDGFFDRMEISLKTCAICLGYLKVGAFKMTTCGHSFCTNCIDRAMEVRKNCPLCAQPIDCSQVNDAYVSIIKGEIF